MKKIRNIFVQVVEIDEHSAIYISLKSHKLIVIPPFMVELKKHSAT